MSDELVKRLREIDSGQMGWGYAKHAADRIEELEERLEAAEYDAKEAEAYAGELEAKLAKAVEALGTALSEMVDYADTHPAWSEIWEAREAARATLAELTGGKDE